MTLGLSTYAFFWQWQHTAAQPMTLTQMITRTAELGVGLFQICDYPLIESADLDAVRQHADAAGVALELGTRGVSPQHLDHYLQIAQALGVTLVRSMLYTVDHRPTPEEAVELLRSSIPAYDEAGITLALETYEQVLVETLVDIVRKVNSPYLGICLDPGNCVAALELPSTTIRQTASYVRNLHIKDFAFSRRDGWVGFTFAGCPLGEGLLDYDQMIAVVRPDVRGINQIIEHWVPWQGDSATTIATENRWTAHSITYLRSKGA